jgi:hypothetical protein
MRFKILLVSVIAIFLYSAANAQDQIVKTNGDTVAAKIKSVGVKTIIYLRYDNQSGPDYTIEKSDVEEIIYENGTTENIAPHHHHTEKLTPVSERPQNKTVYRPNILSVTPIQFTENGLGFGLAYERAIDANGVISFYLPLALTYNLNNGTYYNSAAGTNQNIHYDAMYYAMPGFKVYPTGGFGFIRYAIGPSFVIGDGQKSTPVYDPASGLTTGYQIQDHLVLGVIINNSLNINPTPHIFVGLELGVGFTYLNQVAGLNQGTSGLVQGGFKVGYRF